MNSSSPSLFDHAPGRHLTAKLSGGLCLRPRYIMSLPCCGCWYCCAALHAARWLSSPVSIQTQSLAVRALRKRKPQEKQALALASSQSWLPLLQPSIPIGWRLRLLRDATHAIAFEWKPGFIKRVARMAVAYQLSIASLQYCRIFGLRFFVWWKQDYERCSAWRWLHLWLQFLLDRIYSESDEGKPTLLISLDLSSASLTMPYYLSCSVTASVSPAPSIPGFSPTSVAERSLFASADTHQLRLHVLLAFRKALSSCNMGTGAISQRWPRVVFGDGAPFLTPPQNFGFILFYTPHILFHIPQASSGVPHILSPNRGLPPQHSIIITYVK